MFDQKTNCLCLVKSNTTKTKGGKFGVRYLKPLLLQYKKRIFRSTK